MEIRLTTSEIDTVLKELVQKKFNVTISQSYSCKHSAVDEIKKFGAVSFLFECTPNAPTVQKPDEIGLDRKLDPEM